MYTGLLFTPWLLIIAWICVVVLYGYRSFFSGTGGKAVLHLADNKKDPETTNSGKRHKVFNTSNGY